MPVPAWSEMYRLRSQRKAVPFLFPVSQPAFSSVAGQTSPHLGAVPDGRFSALPFFREPPQAYGAERRFHLYKQKDGHTPWYRLHTHDLRGTWTVTSLPSQRAAYLSFLYRPASGGLFSSLRQNFLPHRGAAPVHRQRGYLHSGKAHNAHIPGILLYPPGTAGGQNLSVGSYAVPPDSSSEIPWHIPCDRYA